MVGYGSSTFATLRWKVQNALVVCLYVNVFSQRSTFKVFWGWVTINISYLKWGFWREDRKVHCRH